MRMRLIGAIVAVAITIGIVVTVTIRHKDAEAEKETITVSVSVVACVDTTCFTLPVPDVAIDVVGDNGKQLAHGVTDGGGKLTLPISYDGRVTVTGTSAIIKDGRFSQDRRISIGEEIGLDIAVPISAQAKPGV